MTSILEVERGYNKLSLEEKDSDVKFVFEPTKEVIYVLTDKPFDDAKIDVESLSDTCRAVGNHPEHDVNECIPFETFKTLINASKSLHPDYVSKKDKRNYECTVAVQHKINVGTSENAKQYTSALSEKRFFEASMDDFEQYDKRVLEAVKDLRFAPDDIGEEKLYSCKECMAPTPIRHPGLLTEIPNTWIETRRSVSQPSLPPSLKTTKRMTQSSQRNILRSSVLGISNNEDERAVETTNVNQDTTITIQNSSTLVSRNYNFEQSLHSLTLDIISVYLKGQKMLYIEAKVYCEQHLYALMLPAIIITAVCSVISVSLNSYWFGGIIVSCFTACNSCILSLVTYLKLDAKAEAHKMTAYSFEKLQSMCEFSSGRILFADKQLTLLKLMEEIGTNVKDIKEKNQFILPEAIRHRFPYLYSTNVFAEVKKIQNTELILINEMQNLMEEGKILKQDIDAGIVKDLSKYEQILAEQHTAFKDLINYRKQYMEIDNKFKSEIDMNIRRTETQRCNCCQWLKN